jgi:hypothetical protein
MNISHSDCCSIAALMALTGMLSMSCANIVATPDKMKFWKTPGTTMRSPLPFLEKLPRSLVFSLPNILSWRRNRPDSRGHKTALDKGRPKITVKGTVREAFPLGDKQLLVTLKLRHLDGNDPCAGLFRDQVSDSDQSLKVFPFHPETAPVRGHSASRCVETARETKAPLIVLLHHGIF